MNLDKIVCECFGVTLRSIKNAVDNGASTIKEIKEATGAATACTACSDEVQRALDYFATERDS